ncbi:MAG: 3-deoxy-D-manno-octulosonic acid kinase [Hydrogenophaga sp.]|nr:3-deoxy-D-manno-octulosonic acid kinase [Hydrogenophaga sp.]
MTGPSALHRGYRLLSRLLALPVLAWLWWRGRKEPGYRSNFPQRLGFLEVHPASMGCVLIQAASVGEVQAARPLIEALRKEWPDHGLVVSTHTPTGAATLHSHFNGAIAHTYSPLDTPGACARFLDRLQPRMLVLMEREIWPEMLLQCRQRAIPVVLVNARLSEHSLRLYQRWSGLVAPIWKQLALVAAADAASLDRLAQLGIPGGRLVETGNLKFDTPPHTADQALPAALQDRTLFVAGSTHEAEEAALLAAWPAWQLRHPKALLVLVPRHPQRFQAVADRLQQMGIAHARHSLGAPVHAATSVLLADTMGELPHWYGAASACFIGGTLQPVGGHNPLEALALGKPVLFGPHTRNAQTLFEAIESAGAGRRVASVSELLAVVEQWLGQPDRPAAMAAAAASFMALHRGATQRCLQALKPWLGQPPAPVAVGHLAGKTHWYDPSLLGHLDPDDFEPPQQPSADATMATGSGRGQAHRVRPNGVDAVLRHYRRGGLVARISQDKYWNQGAAASRAMQEYALLRTMRTWNLPVPEPLAARHVPTGWRYSADILVGLIPDSRNVAQCLSQRRLGAGEWQTLGAAIRRLHDRQVFHADLNCHNLLLDGAGRAWVVDFDRCDRRAGEEWKTRNLERLLRSLRKEHSRRPGFQWQESDWLLLLSGYRGSDEPSTSGG